MKGLIYKDVTVFFKSIDRKMILTAAAFILLLMVNAGAYAGLLASVMFAMSIGIQNVMSFVSDETAGWKKYQLAMPVNASVVVVSKYISVVCTLAVSLAGSLLFNLISSVLFRSFRPVLWGASMAVAVMLPLFWTGISLPLTYWFGFRSAQVMGLLAVFPVFYIVKYFEDGPGLSAMTNSILSYVVLAGIAVAILFAVSMIISMIGYSRKK